MVSVLFSEHADCNWSGSFIICWNKTIKNKLYSTWRKYCKKQCFIKNDVCTYMWKRNNFYYCSKLWVRTTKSLFPLSQIFLSLCWCFVILCILLLFLISLNNLWYPSHLSVITASHHFLSRFPLFLYLRFLSTTFFSMI